MVSSGSFRPRRGGRIPHRPAGVNHRALVANRIQGDPLARASDLCDGQRGASRLKLRSRRACALVARRSRSPGPTATTTGTHHPPGDHLRLRARGIRLGGPATTPARGFGTKRTRLGSNHFPVGSRTNLFYTCYVLAGTLIRTARLRSGLTQAALGARTGRAASEISRWERGVVSPSFDVVRELAEASGYRLDWSLTTADDSYRAPVISRLHRSTPDRVAAGVRHSRSTQRVGRLAARRQQKRTGVRG